MFTADDTQFYCLFWKTSLRWDELKADVVCLYEHSTVYHTEIAVIYPKPDPSKTEIKVYDSSGNRDDSVKWRRMYLKDLQNYINSKTVECIHIPIKNSKMALKWLYLACNTPAPFSVPYIDFILPSSIVQYTDPDINDFQSPLTWKYMFCAKFVLMFLRNCYWTNNYIITIQDRPLSMCNDAHFKKVTQKLQTMKDVLWSINCNRSTPNDIRHMVYQLFIPG